MGLYVLGYCSKTCFDQFKQGAFNILNEFVYGNWDPLSILFRPSVTSGLIVGSCKTHNRNVGSLVNTNVDFYSVTLWHFTPPQLHCVPCHSPQIDSLTP